MPAGFIPDEGVGVTLQELLGAAAPSVLAWQMLFFQNNITPDAEVTLEDLVEANWEGYGRLTLVRSVWTVPTVASGCAHSTWGTDPVVWQVNGGPVQTPYGYAYVDPGTGVLRFIQRFDAEDIAEIIVPGVVKVLPEYTLTSAECP